MFGPKLIIKVSISEVSLSIVIYFGYDLFIPLAKKAFLANGINKSYPKYITMDNDTSDIDTLIINFGPNNILFPNPGGKLRKGKINITYTGKYRDSLAKESRYFPV